MPDILTFNEDLHEYRLNERKIPSVTQILADLSFIDDSFFTLESRERGRKVHKITELYDDGSLDTETVDPRLKGYLDAWIAFCNAVSFVPTMIEKRVFHSHLFYAGTLDRKGVNGKGKSVLLDIKTGVQSGWHPYQLGGYALCEDADELLTVYLKEDGKFRVEEHDKKKSINGWLNIVQTYNIREGR